MSRLMKPKREQKKRSVKPTYCDFVGAVPAPKGRKAQCPKCKRRLEPHIETCTGGREDRDFACCVTYSLKKHRMKK